MPLTTSPGNRPAGMAQANGSATKYSGASRHADADASAVTATGRAVPRIPGTNAEIIRSGPTTFVSNIAAATSAGVSSTVAAALMPALFTNKSTGSALSAAAATDA